MTIESNDGKTLSLPGIPPGHPANAGAIIGMENLVNAPPLDWGDPPQRDPAAVAKAKADWEAAKERAVQAKPGTLDPAGQFARHHGLKDQREAAKAAAQGQATEVAGTGQVADAVATGAAAEAAAPASNTRKARTSKANDQAPDAADGAQQTDAAAKPPRKTRAAAKAAEAGGQDQPLGTEAAKPTRTRRKAASKTVTAQEQGQPAGGSAPTNGGLDIPPITAEAITFLGNPDATAADLFKLTPESQAFVRYHITNMQRQEAESALNYSYLMSKMPKYSPAFEKVADALVARLAKADPAVARPPLPEADKPAAAKVTGVSYGPQRGQMGAYQPTIVQLGKMEIASSKSAHQEQDAGAAQVADDLKRANRVIETAHAMMSAPTGYWTREQVADAVVGDIEEARTIKDERARQLALNAMAESSYAQPHYKDAFQRLAPDLVVAAEKANAAMEADRAAWDTTRPPTSKVDAQEVENTIERGIAPERVNPPAQAPQKATPSVDPTAPGDSQQPSHFGKRLLRSVGVWLQSKAEDKPAPAPAVGTRSVSLDKQTAPSAPSAPADDKTYLVPEVVAQRFLKVERDYYFPDKTHAFADRGHKLATRGAHPEVVRSLIEIAKARGWDSITVKGTDEFRRSAWMEAAQAGLQVAGYKPTALDLAELANKPARNTVEKGMAKERSAAPAVQPARAAAAAPAQQGAQPASAAQAQQDAAAKAAAVPTPSPELEAKARAFEKEKPGFVVKKHPELAQAYGVVDAAKKFAEANLPENVRDEFVSLARRHVMQKILAGEHVKGPRVYMAPAKVKEAATQAQAPTQQAVDQGKSPRAKEVARER